MEFNLPEKTKKNPLCYLSGADAGSSRTSYTEPETGLHFSIDGKTLLLNDVCSLDRCNSHVLSGTAVVDT